MRELREDLLDFFNDDFFAALDVGQLKLEPTSATVSRNKNLGLELVLTASGWSHGLGPDIPAGTLYKAQDKIVFTSLSGSIYTADGVSYRGHHSKSSAKGLETTYRFALHALEMRTVKDDHPSAIIEWVGNLSSEFTGNSRVSKDDLEKSIITIGDGPQSIIINRSISYGGSSNILKLNVAGFTIYLVHFRNRDEDGVRSRDGYIAYKGNPDIEERRKIRECISFVLGLPIISYGYTTYSEAGDVVSMKSQSTYAYGGRALSLPERPPYPINALPSRNTIDESLFGCAVGALYRKYDDLNFLSLSWTYWHGSCAAYSMSAVYFGALIEQLQRTARKFINSEESGLLKSKDWARVKSQLLSALEAMELDATAKKIIRNKLCGLNQLPQNVALDRLLQHLGLSISEAERLAWKHRNNAAHGNAPTDHDDVILNNKLLQIMFHRLLSAISGCSDYYIDYYNLDFPVRAISDPVPGR